MSFYVKVVYDDGRESPESRCFETMGLARSYKRGLELDGKNSIIYRIELVELPEEFQKFCRAI